MKKQWQDSTLMEKIADETLKGFIKQNPPEIGNPAKITVLIECALPPVRVRQGRLGKFTEAPPELDEAQQRCTKNILNELEKLNPSRTDPHVIGAYVVAEVTADELRQLAQLNDVLVTRPNREHYCHPTEEKNRRPFAAMKPANVKQGNSR